MVKVMAASPPRTNRSVVCSLKSFHLNGFKIKWFATDSSALANGVLKACVLAPDHASRHSINEWHDRLATDLIWFNVISHAAVCCVNCKLHSFKSPTSRRCKCRDPNELPNILSKPTVVSKLSELSRSYAVTYTVNLVVSRIRCKQCLKWDGMRRYAIPALPWTGINHTGTSVPRNTIPVRLNELNSW